MTIVALCSAQSPAQIHTEAATPTSTLRALLPIAGMTLIEHQAEQMRAVGVAKIIILVDGVPPELAEACDRIRLRGLAVELARCGKDIARSAAGCDRLLLVADGLIAGENLWRAMAAVTRATLLTTRDASVTQSLERIDANWRWAGIAMLPAQTLAGLADAPEDWDAQLFLFRAAVQGGASQIECDVALFVNGDLAIVEDGESARAVERRLLTATAIDGNGLGRRWIYGPLIRVFAGPLLKSQLSGQVARVAAALGFLAAAVLFFVDRPWLALGFGLAGALAAETATFVAGFRRETRLMGWAAQIAFALQLAAFAVGHSGLTLDYRHVNIAGGLTVSALALMAQQRSGPLSAMKNLVDPPLMWLLAGFYALFVGWPASFDYVAVAAIAALLLSNASLLQAKTTAK